MITEPDYFYEDVQKLLQEVGEVKLIEASMTNLLESIEDIDVYLGSLELNLNEKVINIAKKLKIIGTPTTGLDHIDLTAAKNRNIKIISLKGDYEFIKEVDATFEHTIALMLSLIRKIPFAFASVKNNSWERKKFVGRELKHKTIGILGYGRLGRKVANICSHFKMFVIVNDLNDINIKKDGFEFVSKEELFRNSDILSIHIPLEESTVDLVDKEDLALMKSDSFIINTSRGKIINDEALLDALENGKIAGAAVDVLSTENTPSHPYSNKLIEYAKKHDNLLITPHIAGSTIESMRMTGLHIAKKVIEIIKKDYKKKRRKKNGKSNS
ncbi:MAG: NAD(P)-dependent oxidoreductase [Promethearchaeota archaeon]